MPPKGAKNGKKGGNTGKDAAANKNWEAELIKDQFEQETWQACVSWVVARNTQEDELVKALVQAVQQPQRKLFTAVTWEGTIAKINELGNPSVKKTANVPLYYAVTEPAKKLLDGGEEIPCLLMAKILKFQLLNIKTDDQQRRAAEAGSPEEEEQPQAPPPTSKKEKGGAAAKKTKAHPASPVEHQSEKKTKLKRRDDVEPIKYIDDEPEDGPQHYVLVLGFYDPNLIAALESLGVYVSSVVKLTAARAHVCEEQQEEHSHEGTEKSEKASPDQDPALLDEANPKKRELARKMELFWSGLRAVLDSGPPDSKLLDVAQFHLPVSDIAIPFLSGEIDKAELGTQLFESLAELLYDSLDWQRQYLHYRHNTRIIGIPTAVVLEQQLVESQTVARPSPRTKKKPTRQDKDVAPPPLTTNVDMRFYSNLLDQVPNEACSVPLILHCILEQVVISTDPATPVPSRVPEPPGPRRGTWLDPQLVNYMLQSFLPLVHTEEDKFHMLNNLLNTVHNKQEKEKLLEKFGDVEKKPEHPAVIRHHDERVLRLKDVTPVEGFDPAEVELSMMELSPLWRLIHSIAEQRCGSSCWRAIKQQLQYYCTDDAVTWPEVEWLFHQSVLESMPLTKLDQQGVLLDSTAEQSAVVVNPWDNPLAFAKQELCRLQAEGPAFLTQDTSNTEKMSDGSGFGPLNLSDMQRCRLRTLTDWHYAEHHSATIFPQVLKAATEEYCCLDTFRGSQNNVLYIFCHNPTTQNQCRELWNVALHTDIKFRKYMEYVADTIADWIQEEETKREELPERKASPSDEEKPNDSSEEEEVTVSVEEEVFIRKDSLKASKLDKDKVKVREEETASVKSKKEKPPKGKDEGKDAKKNKAMVSAKKAKDGSGGSTKTGFGSTSTEEEDTLYKFIGYSMDGRLIHVSGHLQHLFPSDGGHIIVETVSFVEGSVMMKVAVRKDGHCFYTHVNQVVSMKTSLQPKNNDKTTKDFRETEPLEFVTVKRGSLSAVLNNGIHLSYSVYGSAGEENTNQQEADDVPPSPTVSQTGNSETRSPDVQVGENQPPKPVSLFNSLSLSVPNGLLLQFLREETPGVPPRKQGILVRQSFPLNVSGQLQDPTLSKEVSRIVTNQGAVIRNMKDGSTEVLFPDGSVSFSQDSGPVWVPDSEIEEDVNEEVESSKRKRRVEKEAAPVQRGCWMTTAPSGQRICTVGSTHKHIPTAPLLVLKATDPITHEVMLSREDLVFSVQNPDGSLTVEHAEGTRITRLYQDRLARRMPEAGAPPQGASGDVNININTPLGVASMEQLPSESPRSACKCGLTECVCGPEAPAAPAVAEAAAESQDLAEDSCTDGTRTTSFACDTEQSCAAPSESEDAAALGGAEEESAARSDEEGTAACVELPSEASRQLVTPGKEHVVMVEKEGCATVVVYPERSVAHVFLADGTVITGSSRAAYQVFPSNAGVLQIQSDGKCLYLTDALAMPTPQGGAHPHPQGTFVMSHSDRIALEVTDADGNHFQVLEDGQISAHMASPNPSSVTQEGGEEPEGAPERETPWLHLNNKELCPRLFLVHADGSGTELLHTQNVEELLDEAYSDPTIALLRDPLPDKEDEFGITILKPSHHSVWSRWLLGKQKTDITPPNLRDRTWHDFPSREVKTPGPPFGTEMGRGLTLTEKLPEEPTPVRCCPDVLEMRELFHHKPIIPQFKATVDLRLKDYIESLMEREQRSEDVMVKDPRTEEEAERASELLNLVMSPGKDEESQTIERRTSGDIASLYSQGVGTPSEQLGTTREAASTASVSFPHARDSKMEGERLLQYRKEMSEVKACREALRSRSIVPYFHAENAPLYQSLLQQKTPDMMSLSMNLPPFTKSGQSQDLLRDAPQDNLQRPLYLISQSGSPKADQGRMSEKRHTQVPTQARGETVSKRYSSAQLDLLGQPRRHKVRPPPSLLTSKPFSVPNPKFQAVDEPVKRRCRTVSLANPNSMIRGFELLPTSVDFGTLQEGTSSTVNVIMKNVGFDTHRFYVKQPPKSLGLRVIYSPGPVAAGLQVELQVQLFAICALQMGVEDQRRSISHDIVIQTETDIIYLPVTATILSERLFQVWLKDYVGTCKGKSSGGLKQPLARIAAPPRAVQGRPSGLHTAPVVTGRQRSARDQHSTR